MKKEYVEPDMLIRHINFADIVCASTNGTTDSIKMGAKWSNDNQDLFTDPSGTGGGNTQ